MEKFNSNEIIPKGKNLSVAISITDNIVKGVNLGKKLAGKTNVEFYMGKVLKLGENATDIDQCPGLVEGDYIMFSQFGGVVAPSKDEYVKVIPGHDVVTISKQEDMNINTIIPTNDRILVEILDENTEVNGVKIEESLDPRDKQTQKCRIVRLGSQVKGDYKVGDLVFIDPYDGNLIINEPSLKLKTVIYNLILFKI